MPLDEEQVYNMTSSNEDENSPIEASQQPQKPLQKPQQPMTARAASQYLRFMSSEKAQETQRSLTSKNSHWKAATLTKLYNVQPNMHQSHFNF